MQFLENIDIKKECCDARRSASCSETTPSMKAAKVMPRTLVHGLPCVSWCQILDLLLATHQRSSATQQAASATRSARRSFPVPKCTNNSLVQTK